MDAIARVPPGRRFLRTVRHPAAVALGEGIASFDRMYDRATTVDEVYPAIVEALVGASSPDYEVLYAVPGSPLVAERTVELLLADLRVTVELVPGMSFADLAWARLAVDPVAAGARLVDGHRFAVEAAGERGPCWWPSATPRRSCPTSSCRSSPVTRVTRCRWSSSPAWGCPTSRCARWRGTTWTGRCRPII